MKLAERMKDKRTSLGILFLSISILTHFLLDNYVVGMDVEWLGFLSGFFFGIGIIFIGSALFRKNRT